VLIFVGVLSRGAADVSVAAVVTITDIASTRTAIGLHRKHLHHSAGQAIEPPSLTISSRLRIRHLPKLLYGSLSRPGLHGKGAREEEWVGLQPRLLLCGELGEHGRFSGLKDAIHAAGR
jgi:hypothetical protein